MNTLSALQHAFNDVFDPASVALNGLPAAADHAAAIDAPAPKVVMHYHFAASAARAWSKLGRFSAIADWQSLVASCQSEERADGFYRVMTMHDASVFVERLETFSHPERFFSYSIISGPLPIKNYLSDFKIIPNGDECDLLWRAWYDVPPGADSQQIKSDLEGLFNNGIDGMLTLLAGPVVTPVSMY